MVYPVDSGLPDVFQGGDESDNVFISGSENIRFEINKSMINIWKAF